uniref:Uncharacterized protein n=1 Tax=Amphora coffeiformis TaxID=265554 RepID=A0A7S3P9I1_9STRA|mmetsp:Transcript_12965/g.24615  ORF Transcript_12965/g.24615 Transcript_12965/m.24615 type:complete len:288 (-) Transcript_12965:96-959(-)|eukprot:scaffold1819_cov160-Amphora_coffeaeformis.AAC.13
MASSTTTAALVTGSLLVAAGLYMGFTKKGSDRSSSTTRDLVDIDDMNNADEDFITPEEVTKIFDRLFMELQGIFSQLMQQIQQIQMAGQKIPEAQLQALLKQELERALAARQKMVLDEYDMDYECLEEATWEFLEDEEKYPQVKRSIDRFQKFWESTTGQPVAGWRKGQSTNKELAPPEEPLSAQETVEAAEKYFDGITEAMRSLVNEYREAGKDLQQPAVANALHLDFAQRANPAGESALESLGISMAKFEASVKEHGKNENVAKAMAMMQMRQQQELQSMATAPL